MKKLILSLLLLQLTCHAETFTDERDGREYKSVKIGSQVWMSENLNHAVENSFCYGEEVSNCQKYGRLYKWDAAKNACPAGWRLPTKQELETLVNKAGGSSKGGMKLKSRSGWSSKGTDAFGFSALPAGFYYDGTGGFKSIGGESGFWSSTENGDAASGLYLSTGKNADVFDYRKDFGFAVRCLKD